MTNIAKYSTSTWLKKTDVEALPPEALRTEVLRIDEETIGDDVKPVIYFAGIKKGWPANITALNVLAEMTGSMDTDDYAGARVQIYIDASVEFAGKRVGGIRLRPLDAEPRRTADPAAQATEPAPDQQAPSPAARAAMADESMDAGEWDDDIPF